MNIGKRDTRKTVSEHKRSRCGLLYGCPPALATPGSPPDASRLPEQLSRQHRHGAVRALGAEASCCGLQALVTHAASGHTTRQGQICMEFRSILQPCLAGASVCVERAGQRWRHGAPRTPPRQAGRCRVLGSTPRCPATQLAAWAEGMVSRGKSDRAISILRAERALVPLVPGPRERWSARHSGRQRLLQDGAIATRLLSQAVDVSNARVSTLFPLLGVGS